MKSEIQLLELSGKEILPYISDLARLRILVFRDYPYLYEGDMRYEADYLSTYTNCKESFMVLVLDNGQVVGASSGVPIIAEDENMYQRFSNRGIPVDKIFYFGESVLLKSYRGLGFGKRFFDSRENYARSIGFQFTTFCAVQRPDDHPLRPAEYRSLDLFWHRLGYKEIHGLQTSFNWRDIDKMEEDSKVMQFWIKEL